MISECMQNDCTDLADHNHLFCEACEIEYVEKTRKVSEAQKAGGVAMIPQPRKV